MKLRSILTAGGLLALVLGIVFLNRKNDSVRTTARLPRIEAVSANASFGAAPILSIAPARASLDGQPAMTPPDPAELSTSERSPLADLLGAAGTRPEAEAKIVLDVLDAYRRSFGVYPAGEDNRQLLNALLGANKHKLPFIPSDHPRISSSGELVDAWGTAFFFHLDSRTSIQVRSAGADRVLFTADDIVAGKPHRPLEEQRNAGGDVPAQ